MWLDAFYYLCNSYTFSPPTWICCIFFLKPLLLMFVSNFSIHFIFSQPCLCFPSTSHTISFIKTFSSGHLKTYPYHLTPFVLASLSAASLNPNISISSTLFLLYTNFSPAPFVALSHLLQTKNFAGVTFFNLEHLSRINCLHFDITELTVTLLPHIVHRSIFLHMTLPSGPHSITFVFSRLTFSLLLSYALLHFRNFFF